jgi:hypothetical protein
MDHEPHLDQRLFRNDIDTPFKEALINTIISAAYTRALESDKKNATDGVVMLSKETQNIYTRVVHEFDADYKEGAIIVRSTAYQRDDQYLTTDAAQRIYDDVQFQRENLQVAFYDPLRVQESFEFFTRHQLIVELSNHDVRLKTTMGYSIEGVEVNYATLAGSNQLDDRFENMYDEHELAEIIRTLVNLELVNASEVELFLNQF